MPRHTPDPTGEQHQHNAASLPLQPELLLPRATHLNITTPLVFDTHLAHDAEHLQLELPPTEMIWQLIRFHERSLLWYHGCYHGPTLRSELQSRLDGGGGCLLLSNDSQWASLLFAILAGSLICANDSQLHRWKFRKIDVPKQAARWYRASVACLNAADYTANHNLYAVQAIATLAVSAHVLGFSNKQSVLLGAALKISQSLGIHRLGRDSALDNVTRTSTEEAKQRVLLRETRRRLWSQICVQDWFSVPSTETCNVNPLFSTSVKPGNRDFVTMEPVPEDIPTYVSYGNYLNDIARLLVGLQEALATSHTIASQYERVIEFDADMRELATTRRPMYFNVTEPVDPVWQDFVPWARRSLTICFSHKIMMIHRSFLSRSYVDPAFSFTRQTCIAAAKTIINEAKQDNSDGGPIIWIDQAFCVAAGIVLALDVRYRLPGHPAFTEHVALVNMCISYLKRFEHSVISARGIRLLGCMLWNSVVSERTAGYDPTEQTGATDIEAEAIDNADTVLEQLMRDLEQHELFPAHTGFTNALIKEMLENAPI